METRQLFGRKQIYTDVETITAENVVEVLRKALSDHTVNQGEIQYLWDYYRGKTPILSKTKEIRENINHKICVNRANEIVTFKRGYGFGEPIQYISRGTKDDLSDEIAELNEQMFLAGKQAEDSALAEWLYVCGLGMRMALPGRDADEPVHVYTLDPRYSFVVRYNGLGEPVVMGVKTIIRQDGHTRLHSVYTKDMYFEIENEAIVKAEPHVLGMVPIFEYPANRARLGAFEVALPLLDALNEVESNRLDDVEQFVNSFLALLGGTIDEETAKKLNEYKMLCLPEGVDAKYLSAALQQNDIQVLSDNLYSAVLTICGIPNRNGGSSTSDTGSAVIMRDGWESAEAQMKSVELEFKRSEKEFLRLVLRILQDMTGLKLDLRNVEIKFSRRNYDNLQTKSQVLISMLNNPRVHPQLAFVHSGLFLDPESAYLQSKEWWESNEQKEAEEMDKYVKSLGDDDAESVPED
ncbi:MAG: phage portal protein [Bacteroidaceae bacterium]|nr:phage portal protein [Bacteroidaceae bacterium]